MKRFIWLLLLISMFIGCSRKEKTLYVVFSYAPLTHIPNVRAEIVTSSILMNFYDPLIRFDEDFRPTPGLAEYWENPDSLTWIFHLRKGIKFQTGENFSSKDVIYTFHRIASDPGSDYRAEISSIDTIITPDSYTVIFKLKTPCSTYLERIGQILIMKNHCPDSLLMTYSCGTGALKYVKTDEKGNIHAIPNPEYFGENVEFDEIVFTAEKVPIPSHKKTKDANYFLYTFSPPEELSREYGFMRVPGPLNAVRYIGINTKQKFLNKKSFRKAIYLAICRERLADSVKKLYNYPVIPAYEMALPSQIGFSFYKPEDCVLKDSIKKLLEISGYDGSSINILVGTSKKIYADLVQKYLEKVGINLKVEAVEAHELFTRVKDTGNFSLYILGLIPQSIDIYSTTEAHFHTQNIKKSLGVKNYYGYSNPTLDSLLETVTHATTKRKREQILQRIESILTDDVPVIPILYEGNNFYLSPELRWKPRIDRLIFVNEIKIKQ